MELPLLLATHKGFPEAWESWCNWRIHIALHGDQHGRKVLWTVNAAKRILKKLDAIGPERAIAAIENSVDRWQDVYEPKIEQQAQGEQPAKWEV